MLDKLLDSNISDENRKGISLVISNVYEDLNPSKKTKSWFRKFKEICTALHFLSYFVDKDVAAYYRKRIKADINETIRSVTYQFTNDIYKLGILLPENNNLKASDYNLDDGIFESSIKAFVCKKHDETIKKPMWCKAFETAEWLWHRFQNVKYFDNSFIAFEYFKAFDLFFKNLVSEYVVIPENATLGETITLLKKSLSVHGSSRIKWNSKFRTKFYSLLDKYLEMRNRYVHRITNDSREMVFSVRKRSIELFALTICAFSNSFCNK